MNTLIQVKHLSFSYLTRTGSFTALKDLSFEINKTEFVCIIGPSGCGKTTLLNCLAGLLKPTQGEFYLNGQTAVVFQDPLLLPWRNVLTNITYGLEIQKIDPQEIAKRAKKILSTLKLADFAHFYPHQLSGGMKQRVNLGRALICNPDILLLDEPLSHLDPQTREQMQLEILRIFDKEKKTFIFVTHLIEEAIFLADRLIILGKSPGTIREVIKINFKRPRDLTLKHNRKFQNMEKLVNDILTSEGADEENP
ncbi:MAG: ABC transporter ATP-binding protein [Candidatus Daviesbacteria bacterium]|nr:ABC transporter ATP-binding protein [Candidatus Daviesbacteria bacterium]